MRKHLTRSEPASARPKSSRLGAPRPASPGAVEVRREAGCVVATLSRPRTGNRLSAAMAVRLIELAEEIEDDSSARMLALTGAGDKFCLGFDDDVDPRLVQTLAVLTKPTLAIINGDCFDEGLELALALDLRVAPANARFAMTQLGRGRMPRFGGTQRLARIVGGGEALKLILTGEPIDGREAMRLKMITYLAEGRSALAKRAGTVIDAILSRAPIAARLAKEAVLKGYDMTLDQGIRLEEDLYALLQTTADRAEGVKAFLEKRKPLFKGS